jgi:hypothetical protein
MHTEAPATRGEEIGECEYWTWLTLQIQKGYETNQVAQLGAMERPTI